VDLVHLLLEKVLPVVGSSAASVVLTYWRTTRGFGAAIKSLTESVAGLEKALGGIGEVLRKNNEEYAAHWIKIEERLTTLDKEILRLQLADATGAKELLRLQKELAELAHEVAEMVGGMQEQWLTVERTLGQLEGTLKALGARPPTRPPPRRG